jgi:hypothetical protein
MGGHQAGGFRGTVLCTEYADSWREGRIAKRSPKRGAVAGSDRRDAMGIKAGILMAALGY